MTGIDLFQKIILFGTALAFLCACQNEPNKKMTTETTVATIPEVDSSKVYILDSGIYTLMSDLFNELEGGSDSNIINQAVMIPKLNEIGYYFQEPEEGYILEFPWDEGTTHFYVSSEDMTFIEQQLKSNKDKLWIAEKFRGIPYNSQILSKYETELRFDWDAFKKDGFGCFQSYGLPIFNLDSTMCIVQINGSCHGTIGSGSSIFLEKKDEHWKIVGNKQNWMS
ncbi:MAG: hypothetical protein AB8B56_06470 [Crocinitomicaceae bacterium]